MTSPHDPIREAPDDHTDTGRDVDDPLGLSQLIASGVIDVVPGDPPVPITVWRVAEPGRIAHLLVGLYTRVGDTIVSLGHDPDIAGAAGAGGCRYLPVDAAHRLADLDHVSGAVRLIMLPWPPATRERTGAVVSGPAMDAEAMVDLFTACRVLLAADGYTIVAVPPATQARTGAAASGPVVSGPAMDAEAMVDLFTACRVLLAADGYTIVAVPPATAANVAHLWQLVPAARMAGLGWVEQIVAITATIDGDQLDVPAAPTDRATLRLAHDLIVHIDLYVFVIRGGHHG